MAAAALIRDSRSGHWLAYDDPAAVLVAASPTDVPAVIEAAERQARRDGLHGVGFLTYEAAPGLDAKLTAHPPGRLPPAWFALFPPPRRTRPPAAARPPALAWAPTLEMADHGAGVARIREYIAAGETYQVNFSYRLRAPLPGAACRDDAARRLFGSMIERQPAGLGALVETDAWAICSASHELFFARRGRCLTSRPMKGTAPRGGNVEEDAALARWLRQSPKNRAENLMIADMVRNDIGRLAEPGSVRTEALFQLEAYPTLWQMTTTVRGTSDAPLAEVFRALFPAASITGAPKRRTMEIIRELEALPREIYTGCLGTIAPSGDACFNVAIRTAWLDKRRGAAEYGVGGAIVWDSDAGEELAETRTKARVVQGDGPETRLLSTLCWTPGAGFRLLEAHLERLQAAARHFFRRTLDEAAIRRALAEAAAALPPIPHRVRLTVDHAGRADVATAPLDEATAPRRVALVSATVPLVGNPWVLHKTTRRDVYDAARAALPEGVDDALLVNEHGEVTESTIANLVADLDGQLVTPPVSAGLLAGVERRHLLESGRVVERRLRPADLRAARGLFLANSVRGLWPVVLVDQ